MAANISELLQNTLSADAGTRDSAQSQLESLSSSNFAGYLQSLSQTLADPATPGHIKNSAGLVIKNALSARELARSEQYAQRWRSQVDDQTRSSVKQVALQVLADQSAPARNVAGQVIAAIAQIELPLGMWNDLVPQLLSFVNQQENTHLRQSSLQAIGFVCEGMVSLVTSVRLQ